MLGKKGGHFNPLLLEDSNVNRQGKVKKIIRDFFYSIKNIIAIGNLKWIDYDGVHIKTKVK